MGGGCKVHVLLITWGEGEGDTYLVRRGSCDWQGPLSLPPRENAPVVHTVVCVHVCLCACVRVKDNKLQVGYSFVCYTKVEDSHHNHHLFSWHTNSHTQTEVEDRLETIITQFLRINTLTILQKDTSSYTVTWPVLCQEYMYLLYND